MKKKELIIIITLFIVALVGFFAYQFFQKNNDPSQLINVSYDNEVILQFDPNKDATYSINGYIGGLVIEVKDEKWRMLSADCPNQICVNTGWVSLDPSITNPGIISCIPNHIVVAPN